MFFYHQKTAHPVLLNAVQNVLAHGAIEQNGLLPYKTNPWMDRNIAVAACHMT